MALDSRDAGPGLIVRTGAREAAVSIGAATTRAGRARPYPILGNRVSELAAGSRIGWHVVCAGG